MGETEAGARGGASFSGGREDQQDRSHAEARYLDEVGAGDGATSASGPPKDQILDSGRCMMS